jgi:predicted nucleic acid-binding protein
MVIVDTSVWVGHLRTGDAALTCLLEEAEVLSHPVVIGELACGSIGNRKEILSLLDALPKATVADDGEILLFLEQHALHGRGLGYIDVSLLASCFLSGAVLLTKDRRLANTAKKLNISRG